MDYLNQLNNLQGRDALRTFVQNSKLEGADWAAFKRLYKTLEQLDFPDLMAELLYRIDQLPLNAKDEATTVSTLTIAYMKRRARRYLKALALKNPARYVQLSLFILRKQDHTLDFAHQWLCWFILKGKATNYFHQRNGRGLVVKTGQPSISRKEEAFPACWDEYIHELDSLWGQANPASELLDFCLRILHRNGQAIPTMDRARLLYCLESDSPWLIAVALKQLRRRAKTDGELLAYRLFYEQKNMRDYLIQQYVVGASNGADPAKKPNDSLLAKVKNWLGSKTPENTSNPQIDKSKILNVLLQICLRNPKNKRTDAAWQLIYDQQQHIKLEDIQARLQALFESKHPVCQKLLLDLCKQVPYNEWNFWLRLLEGKEERFRIQMYHKLGLHGGRNELGRGKLLRLLQENHFEVANFGWFLLKHEYQEHQKHCATEVTRKIGWNTWQVSMARFALQSEYAVEILNDNKTNWYYRIFHDPFLAAKVLVHGVESLKEKVRPRLIQTLITRFWWFMGGLKEIPEDIIDHNEILNKVVIYPNQVSIVAAKLVSNSSFERNLTARLLSQSRISSELRRQVFKQILNGWNIQRIKVVIELLQQPGYEAMKFEFGQSVNHAFQHGNHHQIEFLKNAIDTFLPFLSPNTLLDLLASQSDQQWQQSEKTILSILRKLDQNSLWSEIIIRISQPEGIRLMERLAVKGDFESQLLALENPALLDVRNPALEPLLTKWVQQHNALLQNDQNTLFKALIHPLPSIRAQAMQLAAQAEIQLPFLIRILESGLPSALAFGQNILRKLDQQEYLDAVLAMIDSPDKKVRALALDAIEQTPKDLNIPYVLNCLTEHSDAYIQQYALQKLSKDYPASKEWQYLKKNVMNARNKARQAKEQIKKDGLELPIEVLIEMANSHVQKDAEWAIWQLTRASLEGQEIAGFELMN